jgi:hypothetical protein
VNQTRAWDGYFNVNGRREGEGEDLRVALQRKWIAFLPSRSHGGVKLNEKAEGCSSAPHHHGGSCVCVHVLACVVCLWRCALCMCFLWSLGATAPETRVMYTSCRRMTNNFCSFWPCITHLHIHIHDPHKIYFETAVDDVQRLPRASPAEKLLTLQ